MIIIQVLILFCWAINVNASGMVDKIRSEIVNLDFSCIKPRLPIPCSDPYPGIYLRYWEPSLVVETVKRVGAWQGSVGGNVQFHEVHVYDYPAKIFEETLACPSVPNVTGGVHYLSEVDKTQWRKATIERQVPSFIKVGSWGFLYPRSGFSIHSISAVSSALDAIRAVSIVSDNTFSGHVVEAPVDFQMNMMIDKIQMAYPQKTKCMVPGEDPRLWAAGKESRDGDYVWVYWRYRECCKLIVPPP